LHLGVNKGSRNEPKLIIVKYSGGSKNEPYTAVIGKGITFDTGGLNLKPTGYIETMRTDMSGTAATIGILKNVLALSIKKNIVFAMALAENAIGSGSFKPGDVLRSYNGRTVEIDNTDAEGRLVLADAISYVVRNYKPKTIIDLATLTGACVVALGYDYSGLMSNNDELAKKLLISAQETDDRAWQLPIYPELKDHVKSQIADIKNTGLKGAAGALSAGEFLRQFIEDAKWAHLDIAGTAFVKEGNRFYFGHGATGAGVRLVTDFLKKN
jgi:leucyl aminopeptidase